MLLPIHSMLFHSYGAHVCQLCHLSHVGYAAVVTSSPCVGGENTQADLAWQICQAAAARMAETTAASPIGMHDVNKFPVPPCATAMGAVCAGSEGAAVTTSHDLSAPMVEAAQQLFFVQRADLQSPRSAAGSDSGCTEGGSGARVGAHGASEVSASQAHPSPGTPAGAEMQLVVAADSAGAHTMGGDSTSLAEVVLCSEELQCRGGHSATAPDAGVDHLSEEGSQKSCVGEAPSAMTAANDQAPLCDREPTIIEAEVEVLLPVDGCDSAQTTTGGDGGATVSPVGGGHHRLCTHVSCRVAML